MKESTLQLVGRPEITKLNFEKNLEFEFPENIGLVLKNNVKIMKNEEPDSREAMVQLTLNVYNDDDLDQSEIPFQLSVEIQGFFHWADGLDEETCESLLRINGSAILYSYLRPVITSVTVEANLPPLVIPLMNFTQD